MVPVSTSTSSGGGGAAAVTSAIGVGLRSTSSSSSTITAVIPTSLTPLVPANTAALTTIAGQNPARPPGSNSTPGSAISPLVTTPAATAQRPTTSSELELYAVLQRANLLMYYSTFIAQGGDDVHQLLEAGDEEFLEIMALVGMASKPLHVRRLQKALQDFGSNPTRFMASAPGVIASSASAASELDVTTANLSSSSIDNPLVVNVTSTAASTAALADITSAIQHTSPTLAWPPTVGATAHVVPGMFLAGLGTTASGSGTSSSGIEFDSVATTSGTGVVPTVVLPAYEQQQTQRVPPACSPTWVSNTPVGVTPVLTDAQITKIANCATEIGRNLPVFEPKLVQNKKKISNELLGIMHMTEGDPQRLESFRRYAAIYGRFDAKRKADKALTLHEVSVNEAAAQICLWRPALLTRRDELFPLARQCVKDAGYHYVKGAKRAASTSASPSDLTKRKRSTPAGSVDESSGGDDERMRSQTPSSAGADKSPSPRGMPVSMVTVSTTANPSTALLSQCIPMLTTPTALSMPSFYSSLVGQHRQSALSVLAAQAAAAQQQQQQQRTSLIGQSTSSSSQSQAALMSTLFRSTSTATNERTSSSRVKTESTPPTTTAAD